MKIAIVTPVYPPYRGGMGAVAARDAVELKARGFAVEVLTPNYHDRPQNPEAKYLTAAFAHGNAAALPQLTTQLRKYDLVHLHYPFYGSDIFVWLGSLLGLFPYVLTYHMQPKVRDWRELIFRAHRLLIEPLIVRRAKAVFVSSGDYAQSIGLRHPQLIDFPFGVDEKRFAPGRDDAFRAELGLPLGAFVFVFVGGLDRAHSFKGVEVLLRAAAGLSRSSEWRLLIVGEGDLRTAYTSLAESLDLRDKVIFTGALAEDRLPRAYRAADAHILPSTSRSEAFGLVTLEAAASGLPSIVSDLPGMRTLVSPGETGEIVESNNDQALKLLMERWLLKSELTKQMGQRARDRVLKGYTNAALADRMAEVYNKITAL